MALSPRPEQITLLKVALLLEAASLKEHPAPWLKSSKTVTRGPGGRFASRLVSPQRQSAEGTFDAAAIAAARQRLARKKISPEEVKRIDEQAAELIWQHQTCSEQLASLENQLDSPYRPPNYREIVSAYNQAVREIRRIEHEMLDARLKVNASEESDFLDRRLQELKQVQGADREWRDRVIQTELKYGEQIDQFLANPSDRNHQKLLAAIKANNTKQDHQIKLASPKHSAMLRAILENPQGQSLHNMVRKQFPWFGMPSQLEIIGAAITAVEMSESNPQIELLANLKSPPGTSCIPTDQLKMLKGKEREEYADLIEDAPEAYVSIDGTVQKILPSNRAQDIDSVVWHEVGHAIEVASGSAAAAHKMIQQKQKELDDRDTNNGLDVTLTDDFPQDLLYGQYQTHYTALTYQGSQGKVGSTELISTGMEALADREILRRELQRDREHMLMTIGTLNQPHRETDDED